MALRIDILYTADCPVWEETAILIDRVLGDLGLEGEFYYWLVENEDQAAEWGLFGSPTILIDGVDPFLSPYLTPGLGTRTYFSPQQGMVDHPTYEMLVEVLNRL